MKQSKTEQLEILKTFLNKKKITGIQTNDGYENNRERSKILSVKEYLVEIKPYLKYIINNLKKSDVQKIHLTIAINFIYSQNNNEERVMHSKSDKKELC